MSNISKKKVKYQPAKIYKTNGGKGAIIKGKYRYSLTRIWDNSKEKLLFIMLNPSTADGDGDDPTIEKIVNYADKWGYGGIYVGNLYAYRTSKPSKLKKLTDELEKKGPENEKYLRDLISKT